jgi:hypothetical protein
VVSLTSRGTDALARSARIFGELRALETDLRTLTTGAAFRLDVPGWFGAD